MAISLLNTTKKPIVPSGYAFLVEKQLCFDSVRITIFHSCTPGYLKIFTADQRVTSTSDLLKNIFG